MHYIKQDWFGLFTYISELHRKSVIVAPSRPTVVTATRITLNIVVLSLIFLRRNFSLAFYRLFAFEPNVGKRSRHNAKVENIPQRIFQPEN